MSTISPDESIAKHRDSEWYGMPLRGSTLIRLLVRLLARMELRLNSRWGLAVCVIAAFAGGFGASFLLRSRTQVREFKGRLSDFQIVIPQGETIVSISDPQAEHADLGRLVIERSGDAIQGIPQTEKHIPARIRLSANDAAFFSRELTGIVSLSDSPWQRANKIRDWLVNTPHRVAVPGLATRIPREAYLQMRQGSPVLCGNLADIYVALCEAAGLTARRVGMSVLIRNGLFGIDSHAAAEIWISEMGGWVYQDPTFDCYWEVEGKPASALLLHEALMDGRPMKFAPSKESTESRLHGNYVDPRRYFRHIYYEYKLGGALLYFADPRLEPVSLSDRNWMQTGDTIDIEKLDTNGNTIVERRGQVAPGIFVQLIRDELFVHDRREQSQGIRVRSSSGVVQGCAYDHQRAEDLGLFNGSNLARNGSFRFTARSHEIADDWSVAGPIDAMTVAGGQGVSALAGGRLWQRVQVQPGGRYLLYARVSVVRGLVTWSIADAARGPHSMGIIGPERISEVVSDVVESQSGYLDVGFEVPSGGAFRVIDVIVREAPRFTNTD